MQQNRNSVSSCKMKRISKTMFGDGARKCASYVKAFISTTKYRTLSAMEWKICACWTLNVDTTDVSVLTVQWALTIKQKYLIKFLLWFLLKTIRFSYKCQMKMEFFCSLLLSVMCMLVQMWKTFNFILSELFFC